MSILLVITSDPSTHSDLSGVLSHGFQFHFAEGGDLALEHIISEAHPSPDLVLLDLGIRHPDAADTIRAIRRLDSDLPILAFGLQSASEEAKHALALGACDCIALPVTRDRIETAVKGAIQTRSYGSAYAPPTVSASRNQRVAFEHFLGEDEAFRFALRQAKIAGASNAHVIFQAEPGCGTSMIARAVHDSSSRASSELYICNAASINAYLEDEKSKASGSVFLHASACEGEGNREALHRVLKHSLFLDVRLMVACSSSVSFMRMFPENLSRSMNFVTIPIPALRHRGRDVLLLAQHFLAQFSLLQCCPKKQMSKELMKAVLKYSWPENVKQLQEVMYMMSLRCEHALLRQEDMEHALDRYTEYPVGKAGNGTVIHPVDESGNLKSLHAIESEVIRFALFMHRGSRSDIARKLGIGRTTLYRKAQQMQV